MDELQFEALFAFIAFATTRYVLPQTILKEPIIMRELLILSACYAICSYLRKWAREENKKRNK